MASFNVHELKSQKTLCLKCTYWRSVIDSAKGLIPESFKSTEQL